MLKRILKRLLGRTELRALGAEEIKDNLRPRVHMVREITPSGPRK